MSDALRPRLVIKPPPKDVKYQRWISARVAELRGEMDGPAALARASDEWRQMKAGAVGPSGSALPETSVAEALVPSAPAPAPGPAPAPAVEPAPSVAEIQRRDKRRRATIAIGAVGTVIRSLAVREGVWLRVMFNPDENERPYTVAALEEDENNRLRVIAQARADGLTPALTGCLRELRVKREAEEG